MSLLKLSIIIPFYNSASYIGRCLDTVYNQDIPEDLYEVICIDDCSPDHTKDIVHEYQKCHSNLRMIEHAVNKMQGETRNTGIRNAQGEYIWFVDPDDFIKENCLKAIVDMLENDNLDVLNFDFFDFYDSNKILPNSISKETELIKGKVWLNELNQNFDENASPWRRIIRKNLLLEKKIFFSPRRYEDQDFSLIVVYSALNFRHINQYLYYYYHNPQSTIGEKLTAFNYISSIECGVNYLSFYNTIKEDDPEFAEKVKLSGLWKINFGCKELLYYSYAYRKKMINAVQPHLSILRNNNYFSDSAKRYFSYFEVYNYLFFVLSPLKRGLRFFKRRIRKLLKYFLR